MPSRLVASALCGPLAAIAMSGCNATDGHSGDPGYIPDSIQSVGGIGTGCGNGGPNQICLAVKSVVYQDPKGNPVVSSSAMKAAIQSVNSLWSQCEISFKLEEFIPVQPENYGLTYHLASMDEMSTIRNRFQDGSTLLTVTTGSWDRSGSIGQTSANAWTQLPGTAPYGSIFESSVGGNSNLIAHELGHYLNLLHVSDNAAVMNPIVYFSSRTIYTDECSLSRRAAKYFWAAMAR